MLKLFYNFKLILRTGDITNEVLTKELEKGQKKINIFIKAIKQKTDQIAIGFFGRFAYINNPKLFLDIVSKVQKKIQDKSNMDWSNNWLFKRRSFQDDT